MNLPSLTISELPLPARGDAHYAVDATRDAIDATRVHRTMPGVVSFLLKRPFGPTLGRSGAVTRLVL